MITALGGPAGSFFAMTTLLFGLAAFLTGQAIAQGWRPAWQILPASLLLAAADRLLLFALFNFVFISATGWLIAAAILAAIIAAGFFLTRARKMVQQYPWLYERAGLFGWRQKPGRGDPG